MRLVLPGELVVGTEDHPQPQLFRDALDALDAEPLKALETLDAPVSTEAALPMFAVFGGDTPTDDEA